MLCDSHMQIFIRQRDEDGANPAANWGEDRAEDDTEDFDDEGNLPIPDAALAADPGKFRVPGSIRDWSEEEDDDDCVVVEVLAPMPVSYAYPLPSASVDPGEQVLEVPPVAVAAPVETRKRAGSGATAPPPKRTRKKAGNKGQTSRKSRRPTSEG